MPGPHRRKPLPTEWSSLANTSTKPPLTSFGALGGILGPQDPEAPSVDNYYLLLWLMHGMVAVSLLIIIMVSMIVRLLRSDLRQSATLPRGSSLGFTLASIFLVYAVTLATVYMGLQTIPVFAIVTWLGRGISAHSER